MASKNPCAPKKLGKTKGKIISVGKRGRRWSGCVAPLPSEVPRFPSLGRSAGIPLDEDRPLVSERCPSLGAVGFTAQAREVSPRLGLVPGWRALRARVSRISSLVKLVLLFSRSLLFVRSKSSAKSGLRWVSVSQGHLSRCTMLAVVQETSLETCVRFMLEVILE